MIGIRVQLVCKFLAEQMAEKLDERILEELYSWIDSIPLTRPKKDLRRDFSDGGVTRFCSVVGN